MIERQIQTIHSFFLSTIKWKIKIIYSKMGNTCKPFTKKEEIKGQWTGTYEAGVVCDPNKLSPNFQQLWNTYLENFHNGPKSLSDLATNPAFGYAGSKETHYVAVSFVGTIQNSTANFGYIAVRNKNKEQGGAFLLSPTGIHLFLNNTNGTLSAYDDGDTSWTPEFKQIAGGTLEELLKKYRTLD